jgi:hypothetical protein
VVYDYQFDNVTIALANAQVIEICDSTVGCYVVPMRVPVVLVKVNGN